MARYPGSPFTSRAVLTNSPVGISLNHALFARLLLSLLLLLLFLLFLLFLSLLLPMLIRMTQVARRINMVAYLLLQHLCFYTTLAPYQLSLPKHGETNLEIRLPSSYPKVALSWLQQSGPAL